MPTNSVKIQDFTIYCSVAGENFENYNAKFPKFPKFPKFRRKQIKIAIFSELQFLHYFEKLHYFTARPVVSQTHNPGLGTALVLRRPYR